MKTRREFLKTGAAGLALALSDSYASLALAAVNGPLIDGVTALCTRLGKAGWREMLLDVSGGAFDMLSPTLATELLKPLPTINRSYPGFGDFAAAGRSAIQPGQPDYSLLYHALAAPSVVSDRHGVPLRAFPTLAEIDILENYIYASRQISLDTLRAEIGNRPVALVTFATQYRNAPMAVSGRHAQLCFSRSGIGRIGNLEARYDPRLRSFVGTDENTGVFDFHVVPRRFSTYLAVQMSSRAESPSQFGPQDRLPDDDKRQFWVPLHKIFSGTECLVGQNLRVIPMRAMLNDELASFHRFLDDQHLQNNWSGAALQDFPFVIKDEKIASIAGESEFGPGVMVPLAHHTLVEEAYYHDARLTFPVDPKYSGNVGNLQMSSLFVLPGAVPPKSPQYLDDAEQKTARPAPEYINIRHRVVGDKVENLNDRPDLMNILRAGNYSAQHYIDFSGDGWIAAACPELVHAGIVVSKPAFCMIGLPDFLPRVGQRELMLWWQNQVPKALRDALWATPPLALSQTRIAANIELPGHPFSIDDDTVSAIVSMPQAMDVAPQSSGTQTPNGALRFDKVGLPDGSPGLFDPGWDTSMGTFGPSGKLQRYLVSHGLGSPFIEDAKLCAALGSYWPGVAPDATREYQPDKMLSGISYPWPTAVPFTDEEIGMVAVAEGRLKGRRLSWDGVAGPRRTTFQNKPVVEYQDEQRVDYIDLHNTMTAALTSRIELSDYQARTLAMAALYWSLGIRGGSPINVNKVLLEKASWAVLSFRAVPVDDKELRSIAAHSGAQLDPQLRHYRFDVYRWGKQYANPASLRTVFVEVLEEATAYSDGRQVLLKRGDAWTLDTTIPT